MTNNTFFFVLFFNVISGVVFKINIWLPIPTLIKKQFWRKRTSWDIFCSVFAYEQSSILIGH